MGSTLWEMEERREGEGECGEERKGEMADELQERSQRDWWAV